MTVQPTEAVIAGSKGFALALLAPLTERVGTRPRIAADPSQALKLTGGAGLVVVEFQGERSLDAIRQLLDQAAGLSVIAAVPDGNPGAEEALRSLGVESARWDGKPDDVLSAVSRHLAGASAAAGSAAPAPAKGTPALPGAAVAPPAPAVPSGPAAASGVSALFDDIPLDEAPVDGAVPGDVTAPLLPRPGGTTASGAWPSAVPGAVEAADALGQGLRGIFAPAGAPLAVVAEVMAGMSPMEKAVLLGEPQPVDVEPVRRAAVMRVRVAVALATAPQGAGVAPTDAAAVSALLAEIDGLLSEVNALVAGAPAEVQPSLEQVRNALVKEAIDFSEAAHRAQPAEAQPELPPAVTTAAARKAAQTRIVAVASKAETEAEHAQEKRQRGWVVVLVIAGVVAGAYHAYSWWSGKPAAAGGGVGPFSSATVQELPGGIRMIASPGGAPFDRSELKRFVEDETLKGNVVTELGPSLLQVTARGAPGAPAGPALPAAGAADGGAAATQGGAPPPAAPVAPAAPGSPAAVK